MSRREGVGHTEEWDELEPRLRGDEQRAMRLRESHREKVARNEVRVSPLWAQPARGYNVHIELDQKRGNAPSAGRRGVEVPAGGSLYHEEFAR